MCAGCWGSTEAPACPPPQRHAFCTAAGTCVVRPHSGTSGALPCLPEAAAPSRTVCGGACGLRAGCLHRALCSEGPCLGCKDALTGLKFLALCERGPAFPYALGPAVYVAGPGGQCWCVTLAGMAPGQQDGGVPALPEFTEEVCNGQVPRSAWASVSAREVVPRTSIIL